MKKLLLGLAITTALTIAATPVMAADIDTPLPYDWTGVYLGAFGGWSWTDTTYDYTCSSCASEVTGVELSGSGFRGGVLGGFNFQVDSFVFGIEGDYDFGGELGENDDEFEMTYLDVSNIATIRGRAGYAVDNTLFYGTGGAAFVNTEFGSTDFPYTSGNSASDSAWVTGWVVGAGVEHAFTDALSARIEYLYIGLPSQDYLLDDGAGNTADIDADLDAIQSVRAGVTYKFNW